MRKVLALCLALAFLSTSNAGVVLGFGKGGTSNGSSNIPYPALEAGYNTLTFNTSTLGSTTGTWQPFTFYGNTQGGTIATQNGDGSIFMSGLNQGNTYGGGLASAVHCGACTPNWTGIAFGGGAYFEATISFTGQGTGPYNNGGPAFWALDVEHTSQGYSNVTWPTGGCVSAWSSVTAYVPGNCVTSGGSSYFAIANNTNQTPPNATYWLISTSYNDFFEVDFMEYDCGTTYCYQTGIGNWYDSGSGTHNPVEQWDSVAGSQLVTSGTDFSQPHKYAVLWVPQSQGCAPYAPGQGCIVSFFDGVQVGVTFVWNAYSSSQLPPPVSNSTAMNGMDLRHMFLILGNGTDQPMTVYAVKVWQASSSSNLQY